MIRQLRVGFASDGIVAARQIEDDLYAQAWSRADYDLLPALRQLRIPTLVIHGDRDFIPFDVALGIASAIARVTAGGTERLRSLRLCRTA